METKLYVGNLSYDTTSEGLKEAFSKAGTVLSADVVMDRFTGRARGFGFVVMSTPDEGQEAIKILNGKMLGDREIIVNVARPPEERSSDRGPRRNNYGSRR